MRQYWIAVPLVAIGVLLAGEVIYLMTSHPKIGVSVRVDESQAQPEPVKEVEVKVRKRAATSRKPIDKVAETGVDVEAIPVPPLKVLSPALRVPAAPGDIKPGMRRDQLRSAFGEPAIKTTATAQRELMEVYVFPSKEPSKVTFAQLQDGVVTSAYARTH